MSTQTTAAHSFHDKTNYPIESSFFKPLLFTAILVFIPALLLYYWLHNVIDFRLFQIILGNWISPFILWFFAAAGIYLWYKKRKLKQERRQSEYLSQQLLPAFFANPVSDITPDELYTRLQQESQQSTANIHVDNLLLTRCQVFFKHILNHHNSTTELLQDDDVGFFNREAMRSSFALPRFMIWAIPILGFIGTVWGISQGIAHFSGTMASVGSVADISENLKNNLPLVTKALATAFDTTFLALLLSIPLMLMITWLEKSEEYYLSHLDKQWLYRIKPMIIEQLPQHWQQQEGAAFGSSGTQGSPVVNGSTQDISAELKLLSTQVGALQKTMEDLYETVFVARLAEQEKTQDKN